MFKHCVLSVPSLGPATLPHLTAFAESPFLPHAASSPQNTSSSVFADSYALKPELSDGSIMRMFMDHQQFLAYIKDYLKNPAKQSTSSQICTLLFLVSLQAFSLSAQSHLLSYHNSTCNLLALEWVQYGGEKPRIAFGSLMTRLTT